MRTLLTYCIWEFVYTCFSSVYIQYRWSHLILQILSVSYLLFKYLHMLSCRVFGTRSLCSAYTKIPTCLLWLLFKCPWCVFYQNSKCCLWSFIFIHLAQLPEIPRFVLALDKRTEKMKYFSDSPSNLKKKHKLEVIMNAVWPNGGTSWVFMTCQERLCL